MNHSFHIDPLPAPRADPRDGPFICQCTTCGKIGCGPTRQAAATRHYKLHGNRCRGYDVMRITVGAHRFARRYL